MISVRNLTRRFGEFTAVDRLNFEVVPGTICAFLGPNGAGKSTTMKMLAGCLAPSGSTVQIAGIDLAQEPKAAKASLGYLPEQPPLYPELTVNEYLPISPLPW